MVLFSGAVRVWSMIKPWCCRGVPVRSSKSIVFVVAFIRQSVRTNALMSYICNSTVAKVSPWSWLLMVRTGEWEEERTNESHLLRFLPVCCLSSRSFFVFVVFCLCLLRVVIVDRSFAIFFSSLAVPMRVRVCAFHRFTWKQSKAITCIGWREIFFQGKSDDFLSF